MLTVSKHVLSGGDEEQARHLLCEQSSSAGKQVPKDLIWTVSSHLDSDVSCAVLTQRFTVDYEVFVLAPQSALVLVCTCTSLLQCVFPLCPL